MNQKLDLKAIDEKTQSALNRFSQNTKALLNHNHIHQRDLAKKLNISAPTLSGYMKETSYPSFNTLVGIKALFPEVSLDDLLFSTLRFDDNNNSNDQISVSPVTTACLSDYFGTYYMYYLDTSLRNLNSEMSKEGYPSLHLKYGIVHIGSRYETDSPTEALCSAIVGISTREEATRIKKELDQCRNSEEARSFLHQHTEHSKYTGVLHFSASQHLFISMTRTTDANDAMLIILHKPRIYHDGFWGGVGTVNSISTGRAAHPIVQLMTLSKNYAYLSDEQIKQQLWFGRPEVRLKNNFASREIIRLTETLVNSNVHDSNQDSSDGTFFSKQNVEILINSFIEFIVNDIIENTRLWYGRVSETADDEWYHKLSEAEAFQKEQERRV